MTKTPNIKVQAFIWVALLWILFSSGLIELYYTNTIFNFDVNIFGLVMVGLLLWGLDAISIWTLLVIIVLDVCMFYVPLMHFMFSLFHPFIIAIIFGLLKIYVIFRCFCHVYFLGKRQGRTDTLAKIQE